MTAKDEVLVEYSYLQDGETAAGQLCPACHGGSSRENSLSVSRDGMYLRWYCHRASCNFGGNEGSKPIPEEPSYREEPEDRGVIGRRYYRHGTEIPYQIEDILERKYFFDYSMMTYLKWNAIQQRVIIPAYDWEGHLQGVQLRSEQGGTPKAISYLEDNAIGCHQNWYSNDLIIVEDEYSALRAAEYMNSVSLFGTNLNEEKLRKIINQEFEHIYLALDADAYGKVIEYTKKYRNIAKLIPIKLTKDLKNHNELELDTFMENIEE